MAADFDEESRLANETVTRQASNPNVTVALVMAAVVALVLGLVWNTSSRKGGKPQNAGEEFVRDGETATRRFFRQAAAEARGK